MPTDSNTEFTALEQRPKWSLRIVFWALVIVVILSSTGVLLLSHRDLWLELEMVVGIVAAAIFLFYWWFLYHGVQFADDEQLKVNFLPFDVADVGYEFGSLASGADDPIGFILAIILDLIIALVLSFLISFLIWIGLNGFILGVTVLAMPLFYIFRSSVRFVLRNSPICHHDIVKSASMAVLFSLFKTVWFFAVIAGSHYLARWYKLG